MAVGKTKRIRRDPDVTRELILDVTEKLMVEEGYAAVGSRRIAQELGLTPAAIHYYYPTADDIFIALHSRMTERQLEQLNLVLSSTVSLQAFWKAQSGWAQTALGVEFVALSNHRKAIRQKLASSTDGSRATQALALEKALTRLPFDKSILPPIALATILVAIGRLLANEERVGITQGHEEVRSFVEWAINELSPRGLD